jgi:hypothetical protein
VQEVERRSVLAECQREVRLLIERRLTNSSRVSSRKGASSWGVADALAVCPSGCRLLPISSSSSTKLNLKVDIVALGNHLHLSLCSLFNLRRIYCIENCNSQGQYIQK